jgi:ribosome-binding factor A
MVMRDARRQRVQELLREEISRILITEAQDPRLGFITVTGVEVSVDLHYAQVYVSVFGDQAQQQRAMEGLESANRFIRGLLGRNLDLRFVPELTFKYDRTVAEAARVDQLLNRIAQERKEREPPESSADEPSD